MIGTLALALLMLSYVPQMAAAQSLRDVGGKRGYSSKLLTGSQDDITILSNFNFGTLVSNGAGTATVTPGGILSTTGAVSAAGGFPQALRLELKSHPGNTYQLVLPEAVTLSNAGGATMTLRSFVYTPGTTGVFGSAKVQIQAGGTLQISSTQPPGGYQGNFDVIVAYN